MKTTAIIAAAGNSSRMGKDLGDKIFAPLNGKPVLLYSLEAFQAAVTVDEIIVVCNNAEPILAWNIPKVVRVVSGGADRMESVQNGIDAISGVHESENARESSLIAVHDGARPLVTPKLIDEVVNLAKVHKAAIPAVPVTDTVKRVVRENGESVYIQSTPARNTLYCAQTPQVFNLSLYREAVRRFKNGLSEPITDDSMLVEKMGVKVKIAEGDRANIKITTPNDLSIAETLIINKEFL